jgi:GntR family transcriptional repressor for pyruvate dehydrogenase complex
MNFHDAIFKASGNRIMLAFMQSINNLLVEVREKTVMAYIDLKDSLEQHIEIFNAIKERDSKKAGTAMMIHLSIIEKILNERK